MRSALQKLWFCDFAEAKSWIEAEFFSNVFDEFPISSLSFHVLFVFFRDSKWMLSRIPFKSSPQTNTKQIRFDPTFVPPPIFVDFQGQDP